MSLHKPRRKANQTFLRAKLERKTLRKGSFPSKHFHSRQEVETRETSKNCPHRSSWDWRPSCTHSCPRSSSLFPEQNMACPGCRLLWLPSSSLQSGSSSRPGPHHHSGLAPPRSSTSPFPADLGPSPLWLVFSGCPVTKPYWMNDQTGGEKWVACDFIMICLQRGPTPYSLTHPCFLTRKHMKTQKGLGGWDSSSFFLLKRTFLLLEEL